MARTRKSNEAPHARFVEKLGNYAALDAVIHEGLGALAILAPTAAVPNEALRLAVRDSREAAIGALTTLAAANPRGLPTAVAEMVKFTRQLAAQVPDIVLDPAQRLKCGAEVIVDIAQLAVLRGYSGRQLRAAKLDNRADHKDYLTILANAISGKENGREAIAVTSFNKVLTPDQQLLDWVVKRRETFVETAEAALDTIGQLAFKTQTGVAKDQAFTAEGL